MAVAVADRAAAKRAAAARIRDRGERLIELSHRIHTHPELAFEEVRASQWVADELSAGGFTVEHGCYDLLTAVRAEIGTGPVRVGICAEYDALPGIGHACGHNIIAAAAVGAGLGLSTLVDDLGLTATVLGTPAEEGGGGKILMLERGAFDGLDAAMMVHPGAVEVPAMPGSAVTQLDVTYQGKAAHAGAYPERGLNAADAMTVAQVAIGLLRQQTTSTDRVAGIVTHAGTAANVIPDESAGRWIVRADTSAALTALKARVRSCFEAGAIATGCEVSFDAPGPDYADLRPDATLLAWYCANAEELGRVLPRSDTGMVGAATDMGNVSHAVPTIHPLLGLDCLPAVNHQPEFTAACITPAADRAVLDGAIAMAWTAIDRAVLGTNGGGGDEH